ncbi:carboxypeptidase regulatory-like domain-containing protein [candidate division KSB1 bacterium]|nr:carboxypeptidase regulatory-like domain-containing protein [candidate division KSB1 bacterium]
MFARIAYLLSAALALAAPAHAEAWKATIADTSRIEVDAPATVVRAVILVNPGADTLTLREQLLLPASWQSLADDGVFSLPPRSREVRLVSFRVPAQAPPGVFDIPYQTSLGVARQTRTAGISVIVRPRFQLHVERVRAPKRVVIGSGYDVTFSVKNQSNANCLVTLRGSASNQGDLALSETTWLALPGERRLVTITIAAESAGSKPGPNVITLSAHASHCSPVRATARTDIVPCGGDDLDLHRRLPSVVAVHRVGDLHHSISQFEWRGGGALDANGRYGVAYRVRGPHNLEHRLFGVRDEAFLSVRAPGLTVAAGDQLFGHSKLLAHDRMGRGVLADAGYGRASAGGYAYTSRLPGVEEQQVAVMTALRPTSAVEIGLSGIRFRRARAESDAAALKAVAQLRPWLNAGCESALGWSGSGSASPRRALSGDLRAHGKWGHWSAEALRADASFPGRIANEDLVSSSWRLLIRSRLIWTGAWRWSRQNRSSLYPFQSSFADQSARTGLDYELLSRTVVGLEVEQRARHSSFGASSTDSREQRLTGRFRGSRGIWSLDGSAGAGVLRGTLVDDRELRERFGAGLTVRPLSRLTLSSQVERGFLSSSVASQPSTLVQLSASYRPTRGFSLTTTALHNDLGGPAALKLDQWSADARWEAPFRHIVTLRFRTLDYRRAELADGAFFAASYEIPFNVPLGRKPGIRVIKGRVTDASDPERGISDVFLSMGESAVMTDSRGRFRFATAAPGPHYIEVDPSTLGPQCALLPASPLLVCTSEPKTETLALSVVRSAKIAGELIVYGAPNGESRRGLLQVADALDSTQAGRVEALVPLRGIGGAYLELRGDEQTFTVRTDAAGRFALDNLTPGRWIVQCRATDIPSYHATEQPSYELDVLPGTEARLLVRVLPCSRPVYIVDEGQVPKISVTKR